jgi:hypothetical protein
VSDCSILLLYPWKIAVLDWKSGESQDIPFSRNLFSQTVSRAPSGKIISVTPDVLNRIAAADSQKASIRYLITNNNLSSFVYLDADLNGPYLLDCSKCSIPIATPGVNTFALKDGKFYDFEFLSGNELAIIDEKYHLGIGGKGTLVSAASEVGSVLFAQLSLYIHPRQRFPDSPTRCKIPLPKRTDQFGINPSLRWRNLRHTDSGSESRWKKRNDRHTQNYQRHFSGCSGELLNAL